MSENRLEEPGDPVPDPTPEAPEATPEPVTAEAPPEPEVEEDPTPVPTVPLAALNEERHKNREFKAQLAEERRQREELKAIVEDLRKQAQAQRQPQEDQFKNDPLGAIRQDIQGLRQVQEQAQTAAQLERQQADQRQALERTVVNQVQEFSKTTPDYPDALKYMLETRANELRLLGVPQEQIEVAIEQESIQLAHGSVQRGENTAETVYNLAKLRGYKAPKAQKSNIETIEKGQKAAQTLDGTRGRADEISWGAIEKMSDKDFDKYWDEEVAPKRSRH